MKYMISAVVLVTIVMIVKSHPICKETTDQSSDTACYTNLTANISFLNEWMSLHDKSKGINALRRHKSNSIASILFKLTEVILN